MLDKLLQRQPKGDRGEGTRGCCNGAALQWPLFNHKRVKYAICTRRNKRMFSR